MKCDHSCENQCHYTTKWGDIEIMFRNPWEDKGKKGDWVRADPVA